MKTSVLLAIVGLVAVVAVAGTAVASGAVANEVGTQAKGNGSNSGHMGAGFMHQWMHSWQYQWNGTCIDCPHDYNWNYSYDYDYETCPIAG